MHRLLKRQLKKAQLIDGDLTSQNFKCFCNQVNQAYEDADEDRLLQENILNTSSRELRKLYNDIRKSYDHDQLTGILNKQSFEKKLENKINFSNITNENGFTVCFLDIDHFKRINDTLGHDIGDLLLKHITRKIKENLGSNDLFARIGGDEFVILFDQVNNKKDCEFKLEELIKIIRSTWFLKEHELILSASIGVTFYPQDDQSVFGLMKKADLAMYQAKFIGRDNFVFYSKELEVVNEERMALEQSMPSALENKEFELYFQPIVNSRQKEIIGAEALLRWKHPTKGLIKPLKFIDLAENTGFIIKLGTWVLQESCYFISQLPKSNTNFKVSVNVSVRQFQHCNICEVLEKAIKTTGINPNQLAIEITESILGNNVENIINRINRIKSLGVHIYMDDFGTGFSSLSFLNTVNFDVIKIDKSFIDDIKDERSSHSMVNTIISMSNALKKKVIAEGVETKYQLDYLLKNGCETHQGYLFSEPLSADHLMKLFIGTDNSAIV